VNFTKLRKLSESLHILQKIQNAAPDIILAGGAIRDAYHNKHIKDYDFFVSSNTIPDVYNENFWKNQFNLHTETLFGDTITNLSDNEDASCEGANHVDMVWEINKNEKIYNIVVLDMNPIEYVNRFFDIGICKTYSDGKRIRLTSDFMHDSQNHLLTIVSEDMSQREFNRMMNRHVEAVKNKYTGYKLVIPPRLAGYHKEYNNTIKI